MLEHSLVWPPGRVVLPGLDPSTRYLVTIDSLSRDGLPDRATPPWAQRGVTLYGKALGTLGLQAPYLTVDTLVVIHARAVDA